MKTHRCRVLNVLLSVFYEYNIKLIIQAAAEPGNIFVGLDLNNRVIDEAFSFDRTRSRLEEMGSIEYLKTRKWTGTHSIKLFDEMLDRIE